MGILRERGRDGGWERESVMHDSKNAALDRLGLKQKYKKNCLKVIDTSTKKITELF